jgi:excisionase family DNA binding protein
MKINEPISTDEVARLLGVSVSTVKRWVDLDILPAIRTCGGHRRIRLSDVVRLARLGLLPDVDLARLPLMVNHGVCREIAELKGELHRSLIAGDESGIRTLLAETHKAGMAAETLADELIRPAMHRLGQEWSEGQLDVMHEHRGVQACFSALCELKHLLLAHADRSGPVAVGGAPEKDPYLLPCLLAELVLIDAGWQVINLGANTPLSSFQRAVDEFRPRMLWLSISYLEDRASFLESYRRLHDAAIRHDVAVVVGGQALHDEIRSGMPYTTFGDGLKHLAAFARTLHPQPKPPMRGRPRSGDSGPSTKKRSQE